MSNMPFQLKLIVDKERFEITRGHQQGRSQACFISINLQAKGALTCLDATVLWDSFLMMDLRWDEVGVASGRLAFVVQYCKGTLSCWLGPSLVLVGRIMF